MITSSRSTACSYTKGIKSVQITLQVVYHGLYAPSRLYHKQVCCRLQLTGYGKIYSPYSGPSQPDLIVLSRDKWKEIKRKFLSSSQHHIFISTIRRFC